MSTSNPSQGGAPTMEHVRSVAPALEKYTQGSLFNDVWKRPGLSPRDRSIATVTALTVHNHIMAMPFHFGLALDNGVKPGEVSEIITHLAFSTKENHHGQGCFICEQKSGDFRASSSPGQLPRRQEVPCSRWDSPGGRSEGADYRPLCQEARSTRLRCRGV